MKRITFVRAMAGASALVPIAGHAATMTPSEAIARLFTATTLEPMWFAPLFRAGVPVEKVRAILADVRAALGDYVSIAPNGTRYAVRFTHGSLQAEAGLDARGAFTGLLFSRMQSATAQRRLAQLFGPGPIPAAWFSPSYLGSLTIDHVRTIVANVEVENGAFVRATPAIDGSYDITYAHGSNVALIFLRGDGAIEGLTFKPHS